jgi:hypothetical protein
MGLSSWWVAHERRGGGHWPLAVRVGLLLVIIAFIIGLALLFA